MHNLPINQNIRHRSRTVVDEGAQVAIDTVHPRFQIGMKRGVNNRPLTRRLNTRYHLNRTISIKTRKDRNRQPMTRQQIDLPSDNNVVRQALIQDTPFRVSRTTILLTKRRRINQVTAINTRTHPLIGGLSPLIRLLTRHRTTVITDIQSTPWLTKPSNLHNLQGNVPTVIHVLLARFIGRSTNNTLHTSVLINSSSVPNLTPHSSHFFTIHISRFLHRHNRVQGSRVLFLVDHQDEVTPFLSLVMQPFHVVRHLHNTRRRRLRKQRPVQILVQIRGRPPHNGRARRDNLTVLADRGRGRLTRAMATVVGRLRNIRRRPLLP